MQEPTERCEHQGCEAPAEFAVADKTRARLSCFDHLSFCVDAVVSVKGGSAALVVTSVKERVA